MHFNLAACTCNPSSMQELSSAIANCDSRRAAAAQMAAEAKMAARKKGGKTKADATKVQFP